MLLIRDFDWSEQGGAYRIWHGCKVAESLRLAVRKICKQKGCRASPRCDHPWWFDVMHAGKRWRMRVDDFAFARGATAPVGSKQTAERV